MLLKNYRFREFNSKKQSMIGYDESFSFMNIHYVDHSSKEGVISETEVCIN